MRPLVATSRTVYITRAPTFGVTVSTSSESYGSRIGAYKEIRGVQTPGYHVLVENGRPLPMNPYSSEWVQLSGEGVIRLYRSSSSETLTVQESKTYGTSFFAGFSIPPSILTDRGVIVKALNRARSNQWNVPVFIAELGKTSEMVYTRATHLVGLIRAAKRGDFAAFVKGLKPTNSFELNRIKKYREPFLRERQLNARQAAASLLMEAQYGWMPFVLDIQSAMDTLVDLAEEAREGRDRGLLRVYARDRKVTALFSGQEDVGVTPDIKCYKESVLDENYRLVWRFRVKPEDIPSRLGLRNAPIAAWELTTLSWFVDWAIPISDYLSGFGDRARFEHVDGCIGNKRELKVTRSQWSSSDYPSVTGPPAESVSGVASRVPFSDIPEVTLRHLRPEVPTLGPMKAAVTMALLSNLVDSLRR